MGCNSHTHIEYRNLDAPASQWWHFIGNVDRRNYALYAKMAGVRNYQEVPPVAAPRGIPDDCSGDVKYDYYLQIDDAAAAKNWEGYCSAEKAAYWVSEGFSTTVASGEPLVSNPDYHTPSYLSAAEFCAAVAEVAAEDVYWTAIAALVASIAARPGYECRVVFWFDN